MIVSIAWPHSESPAFGVMNRIADDLADQFRNLGGTDNVRVLGAPREEVSVTVNAAELSSLGLTATEVANSISRADTKLPAGALRNQERNLFIEVDGEVKTVDRVRRIPLVTATDGSIVTVGDVADVRKDWQDPPADIAYSDGRRSVLVATQTRRDIRVDAWAESARDMIESFAAASAAGADVDIVFDQSTYTEERLSTLSGNLLAGALLVALIVFVGMAGGRPLSSAPRCRCRRR